MKPVHYYYLTVGSWYMSFGIQSVAFAWLVTFVLEENAARVGIAQMCLLLPSVFLMLIGGAFADHYGGRKMAMFGQLVACLAPLALTLSIFVGWLSYETLLLFALIIGSAQAFITPARDGLLVEVAQGRIQPLVVRVSLIQFGIQTLGYLLAGMSDEIGAVVILSLQSFVLAIGLIAFWRLRVSETLAKAQPDISLTRHVVGSIFEGYRSVIRSPAMSMVVLQSCAMGTFFMGSYLVTLPLLVREVYHGSSQELAWINAANSIGIVVTTLVLIYQGDLKRQGRALLLAQGIACFALASAALNLGLPLLIASLFVWGLCGGISFSMARTIMQEQAPPDQRARMMSFYSLAFSGSSPLGALLCGFLANWFGSIATLILASIGMLVIIVFVAVVSNLWQVTSATPEH